MATPAASESAELAYLRERLGVSDSDLSKQMKILQEAGYVKVTKHGRGRGASTWFRLTREGRDAFEARVAFLQALVSGAPASAGGRDARPGVGGRAARHPPSRMTHRSTARRDRRG